MRKTGRNIDFQHNIVICTLIDQGEPLRLVRPVWVEIQDNKVCADVNNFSRWVTPVEPRHHLTGVTIQQLDHIRLVHDVEESEVKQDDRRTRDLEKQRMDRTSFWKNTTKRTVSN